MTTPSEHARNAAATLPEILNIAPSHFDVDSASAVIEKVIKHATRERESRSRRQLSEAKAAAQERLVRLLSSSPAVIYSFKASGDFAPTFVSDNIGTVFGTRPPNIWRTRPFGASGFTPMISPASRKPSPNSFTTGFNPWSTASAAATAPIAG
jgi:adenylate cyclase